MGTTDQISVALQKLEDTVEFMNEDEQTVMTELVDIVNEIGAGVVRGQKIYGYMNLDEDDRNLLAQGDEEDRDQITYRLMEMVRDRRRRKKLGRG